MWKNFLLRLVQIIFFRFLYGFSPSHPNSSMHILHTVLCTFTNMLTRRIFLAIKSLFSW